MFDGALTLTHSASLSLPGTTDITTSAGDSAFFVCESAGNWRCASFTKANGTAIIATTDINGLTEKTELALDDSQVVYDPVALANRKQKLLRLYPGIAEYEAGETIATTGNPVQVRSDGKVYSSMDNIYGYIGVNLNTVTAGQTVRVQFDGVASLSGTQNERKYLSFSSSNASTQKANLTAALFFGAVSAVGQYAYFFGGYTGSAYPTTNYRYDTVGNTWATMTALPFAAVYPAAGTDGTDIYVFRFNQSNS